MRTEDILHSQESIVSKMLWRSSSQNVLSTSCKPEDNVYAYLTVKLTLLRLSDVSVDAFVKEHNIDCEWTPRPTYDICLSEEFKAYSNIAYDNVLKRGGAKEVAIHVENASSVSLYFLLAFATIH